MIAIAFPRGAVPIAASLVGMLFAAHAATVQTIGTGSAVSSTDRTANFDSLTSSQVTHLDNYTEGDLSITTSGDSWAADSYFAQYLDPFNGANSPDRAFYAISTGNEDWVTIQFTNHAAMHGAEFMYGNTWTTGTLFKWGNSEGIVDWQTWKGGSLVSSGTIGGQALLPVGTVLGFYDPVGFDQLLVRCTIAGSGNTNLQALALDNLRIMLTNLPPAPVIDAADFSIDPVTRIPTLTVYDTIPGCQYRLVASDTVAPGAWQPVNVPAPDGWQAGGGTLSFTDPAASGKSRCFYRIEAR